VAKAFLRLWKTLGCPTPYGFQKGKPIPNPREIMKTEGTKMKHSKSKFGFDLVEIGDDKNAHKGHFAENAKVRVLLQEPGHKVDAFVERIK
jgi:hypothetical protein